MKQILLSTVALAALSFPAMAQEEIAPGAGITGVSTINDRIDDVEEAVQDDIARSNDRYRYGFNRQDGLSGGVNLAYSARSGNSDGNDFTLGGRLTYSQGPFTQTGGLLIDYADDEDGQSVRKDVSAIYDASYDFTPRTYGFILGRVSADGTVSDDLDDLRAGQLTFGEIADLDGRVKRDAFVGVGPGYRIINTPDTTWRVQAGVGVRYVQQVDLNQNDYLSSSTDTGYIVSSRAWHRFNDRVSVSNDTDYLKSDANETIWNDLGVNYGFTDTLVGRASYRTEYVSDREERTDNKFGLSLGFKF